LSYFADLAGWRGRRLAECRSNYAIGGKNVVSRLASHYPSINDTMAKDARKIMILAA
jgi:hypothetical protein